MLLFKHRYILWSGSFFFFFALMNMTWLFCFWCY
jgi:hypothetical protein